MRTARDIMHTPAPSVSADMSAKELHHFLVDRQLDGACVVRDGVLVGVVTTMDLVFREKKVHLPSFFVFLDAVIPLGNPFAPLEEVTKAVAAKVGDLATKDVITVRPDTPLDEVATRMVEDHLSVLPVVDGGQLVGMVTKEGVLKASLG